MAPRVTGVFDASAADYDAWYDRHPQMYAAEIAAVERMVDREAGGSGPALEIGVGSGRFAGPLGIDVGVDLAPRMVALANSHGCRAVVGDAERLPFRDGAFTWTAFLTSLCFMADPARVLREAWRVTSPGGFVVVAFLNRLSAEGRAREAAKATDAYFASASLLSGPELAGLLGRAGFAPEDSCQVVAQDGTYDVGSGADRGLYCAMRGRRADRTR